MNPFFLTKTDSLWMDEGSEGNAETHFFSSQDNQDEKIETNQDNSVQSQTPSCTVTSNPMTLPAPQLDFSIVFETEDTNPIRQNRIIDLDQLIHKKQLYQYILSFKSYEDIKYELKTVQSFMMSNLCVPLKSDDQQTKDFKKLLLQRLTRVFRWLLHARDTWPNVQPLGAPYEK